MGYGERKRDLRHVPAAGDELPPASIAARIPMWWHLTGYKFTVY